MSIEADNKNPLLELAKTHYQHVCSKEFVLEIPKLPPSANSNYEKSIFKNKHTGRSFLRQELSDKVVRYRILLRNHFIKKGISFKPKTILAAVVELYGPEWLNKDGTSKMKDADNMIKPLFDAFEEATHIPDETIHEFVTFKMYAEKEKCVIRIYEMSPVIYTK